MPLDTHVAVSPKSGETTLPHSPFEFPLSYLLVFGIVSGLFFALLFNDSRNALIIGGGIIMGGGAGLLVGYTVYKFMVKALNRDSYNPSSIRILRLIVAAVSGEAVLIALFLLTTLLNRSFSLDKFLAHDTWFFMFHLPLFFFIGIIWDFKGSNRGKS